MKDILLRSTAALLTAAITLGVLVRVTGPSHDEQYAKSIVKVLNSEGTGGGTGWIADSRYFGKVIVTNAHVCAVASGGYARIESATGAPSISRILATSFVRDLCMLEGIDAPSLPLAKSDPKKFDELSVMGHPGLRPTAPASGVFTGNGLIPIGFGPDGATGKCPEGSDTVDSIFGTFCVLQMELSYTTVPIMPGNSGSPVTNTKGEVIGVMNSADRTGNQGMFIPLKYVKQLLNTL